MTAVEWLIQELKENGIKHLDLAEDIIEQAKMMEKSRLMNFFCYAYIVEKGEINSEKVLEAFKDYYDRQYEID